MNGAISDVCASRRSIPAGSSSISTSCGSATAASVPSNGRYANDAVEPTMATPITTTHVSDEDPIFEIRCLIHNHSFEAHSRHRPVHPHGSRLQRCRTHRKKQPVHRRNVIGSARASDRGHSAEATIVARACVEDVDETFAAAHVDT